MNSGAVSGGWTGSLHEKDDKVLSVEAQERIDEARETDEEYSSEEVKWMFDGS
jgi:hypothetical protein